MEPGVRDRGRAVITQIVGLSRPERISALQHHFPADPRTRNHILGLLDLYDALRDQTAAVGADASDSHTGSPTEEGDAASAALLTTGESYGPYCILRPLGAGGMGQVFLAQDTRLGRHVALKSLAGRWLAAPNARDRLMREARAVAALVHPNIATLYDVLEHDHHLLLVMEYVDGQTVQHLLDAGPMPPPKALHIAAQVSSAIAYAHDHHVIHCDVKPGNIQVCPDDVAKVLDFGLARLKFGQDDAEAAVTSTGRMLGTPGYMAPERIVSGVLNASGDIYAIGVVLFEMLTGRRFFDPSQTADQWLDVVEGAPARLSALAPSLPPMLHEVVGRALAADPSERYQTAHDLCHALTEILDNLDRKGSKTPRSAPARRTSRDRSMRVDRALHAVAIAATAIGGVGLAGLITSATFNMGLGRSAEFNAEPPIMVVVWGLRSLVGPAVLAVIGLIAVGLGVAIGKIPLKLMSVLGRHTHRAASTVRPRSTRPITVVREIVTATGAPVLLIAEVISLVILLSIYGNVFASVADFAIGSGPSDLSALGPEQAVVHRRYRQWFALHLLVFAAAWFQIAAVRRRQMVSDGGLVVAGGIALTLLSFFLLVAPYRTLLHNEAERIVFDGKRCYLVGQHAGDVLVFCPAQPPPRVRVARLNDPQLIRQGIRESIFTEVK